MVSVAYKNRTREEIIAAFRESIRRKHEWQKRAEEEIKKIRQGGSRGQVIVFFLQKVCEFP